MFDMHEHSKEVRVKQKNVTLCQIQRFCSRKRSIFESDDWVLYPAHTLTDLVILLWTKPGKLPLPLVSSVIKQGRVR